MRKNQIKRKLRLKYETLVELRQLPLRELAFVQGASGHTCALPCSLEPQTCGVPD